MKSPTLECSELLLYKNFRQNAGPVLPIKRSSHYLVVSRESREYLDRGKREVYRNIKSYESFAKAANNICM